jgi:hypothetical protein
MKANAKYRNQPKHFWANVRTIGQALGYADKNLNKIKTYTADDLVKAMLKSNIGSYHLIDSDHTLSKLAIDLLDYFSFRAELLNDFVETRLMNVQRAREVFEVWRTKLQPNSPVPMNKQKGTKKQVAYLTALVNMIIDAHIQGLPCDYDPRILTSVTRHQAPVRTLARRLDGCFPSPINPIAVWEVKEYYYTTTFGSRIADGVYETLLDGYELEELRRDENIHIEHVLIVDAYDTWWLQGKSYLCRLVDALHMGYVDEILFGYEVVEVLPQIVQKWVEQYQINSGS